MIYYVYVRLSNKKYMYKVWFLGTSNNYELIEAKSMKEAKYKFCVNHLLVNFDGKPRLAYVQASKI